jgi:hypothetical protein
VEQQRDAIREDAEKQSRQHDSPGLVTEFGRCRAQETVDGFETKSGEGTIKLS